MRLGFMLFCVFFTVCRTNALGIEQQDEFYAVFINGKKVGYSTHARRIVDGKVMTSEMIDITVQRRSRSVRMRINQSSVETTDGKPISFAVNQVVGDTKIVCQGILNTQGKLDFTATHAGKTNKGTIKWHPDAVMAEGLRLLLLEYGLKPGTTFKARLFEPASLVSRQVTIHIGPQQEIDLVERKANLTEIKQITKTLNTKVTQTSYVDKDLSSLKVVVPIMGMTCEFISCQRQYALGKNENADLLDKAKVLAPRPLGGLSFNIPITYELTPVNGGRLAVPSGTSQSVAVMPEGRLAVTVHPTAAISGEIHPYTGNEPSILEALQSNLYIQSNNPKIITLAHQAAGNTKDVARAVRQIERFVCNYIVDKHSLGYASALDIVTHRKGDCSEHAILTVALCRALGVPAQVATGIVYAGRVGDNVVFVPHAWTRVYIGSLWIDIDATRIERGFGTGHIAMAYSNGSPEDMLSSLGQFKITRITVNQ